MWRGPHGFLLLSQWVSSTLHPVLLTTDEGATVIPSRVRCPMRWTFGWTLNKAANRIGRGLSWHTHTLAEPHFLKWVDASPYANCLELGGLPGLYFTMSGAELLINASISSVVFFFQNPASLPHVSLDLNILQIKSHLHPSLTPAPTPN